MTTVSSDNINHFSGAQSGNQEEFQEGYTLTAILDPLFSPTSSPEKTILGLSVDTFSFVFLGIGAVAPVIFLTIVFITMRCYSRRKLRRFKQYEARMRVTQEIWDLERRHYFQSWQHRRDGRGVGRKVKSTDDEIDFLDDSSGGYYYSYDKKSAGLRKVRTPLEMDGATQSNSNPDVFFKELPNVLFIDRYRGPHHVRALSSPGEINPSSLKSDESAITASEQPPLSPTARTNECKNSVTTDGVSSSSNIPKSPSRQSIDSEEVRVLESFDKIYEDLDIETASSTGNAHSDSNPPGLIRQTNTQNLIGGVKTSGPANQQPTVVANSQESRCLLQLNSSVSYEETRNGSHTSRKSDIAPDFSSTDGKTADNVTLCDRQIVVGNKPASHHRDLPSHYHRNSQPLSISSSSNIKNSLDITEMSPLRPVTLPLMSDTFQGYPLAVVSTVTLANQGSNEIYMASPLDTISDLPLTNDSDVKVFSSGSLVYSNKAYLRQDTPPETEITKL